MKLTMVRQVRGRRGDDGASSVEYALVLFAMAVAIVVALVTLGDAVFDLFDASCRAVRGGTSPASSC